MHDTRGPHQTQRRHCHAQILCLLRSCSYIYCTVLNAAPRKKEGRRNYYDTFTLVTGTGFVLPLAVSWATIASTWRSALSATDNRQATQDIPGLAPCGRLLIYYQNPLSPSGAYCMPSDYCTRLTQETQVELIGHNPMIIPH